MAAMAGKPRKNWTEDETIMVFVLYLRLPHNELDDQGKRVQSLARTLHRTPDAVALKAWNIAAYDANRIAQSKKGLTHGAKFDREIWDRYAHEGDKLVEYGIELLDKAEHDAGVPFAFEDDLAAAATVIPEGKERFALVRQRVNQEYFRNSLMANYQKRCCLTGIGENALLMASHIKPWKDADSLTEKLSPANGLLLNAFHDKAFDKGLMTIDFGYRVRVSSKVGHSGNLDEWLWAFDGRQIQLPTVCPPSREFIEWHQDKVFLG